MGLEKTIQSISSQSYGSYEHIIIDACSDDGSAEIISEYVARDIHARSLIERDNGKYNAMNKGIQLCTGEFIIFINSGDELNCRDSLRTINDLLATTKDQSSTIFYGDRRYIDEKRNIDRIEKTKDPNTINKGMFCGHQSIIYPRKVLIDYPYNEAYHCSGDYDQLLRLYNDGIKFNKIESVICNFYGGGVSESGLIPHIEAVSAQITNGRATPRQKLEASRYFPGLKKCISEGS